MPDHTTHARTRGAGALLAAAIALAATGVAGADWIELTDGQLLRGTVLEWTDDGVIVDNDVLGRLVIPPDRIVEVRVEDPDATSAGAATRTPPGATASDATTSADTTGEDSTPEDATVVDSVPGSDGAPALTPGAVGAEAAQATTSADAASVKPTAPDPAPSPWTASLDVALDGTSGNTENLSVRLGMNALRKTAEARLAIDASYYLQTQRADISSNKFTTGARHDWLLPKIPWFVFADGRYDYDQFQSWEHRVGLHGGGGYEVTKSDDLAVVLRGGIGGRREFGSPNEEWIQEILGGVDLRWALTERQSIEVSSTLYPAADDFEDLRTLTSGNWRYTLDPKTKLSLLVGFTHEYQSVVPVGNEQNDLRAFAGIRLSF